MKKILFFLAVLSVIVFISYEIEMYKYHLFLSIVRQNELTIPFWKWFILFGGK